MAEHGVQETNIPAFRRSSSGTKGDRQSQEVARLSPQYAAQASTA